MKTLIAVILTAFLIASFSAPVKAQNKPAKQDTVQRDTLVQLVMPLKEYNALEQTINANIDSKSATNQIIAFLRQRIVQPQPKQPADKPKK